MLMRMLPSYLMAALPTLALTFAHPVAKRNLFKRTTHPTHYDPLAQFASFHNQAQRDYDPLSFNR